MKGGWNFRFERHFNDWELEVVQNFLSIMNSRSCSPQLRNKLWWKETKSGSYFVMSCFDLLESRRQHQVPIKMLWNPIVPTKAGFCLGGLVR